MLYTYKMKNDNGFAPNPYGTAMTLATCKPGIRASKQIGDWVAGFTSKALCGDPVDEERLIFLMQVTEVLSTADYFHAPRLLLIGCGSKEWLHPTLVQSAKGLGLFRR